MFGPVRVYVSLEALEFIGLMCDGNEDCLNGGIDEVGCSMMNETFVMASGKNHITLGVINKLLYFYTSHFTYSRRVSVSRPSL